MELLDAADAGFLPYACRDILVATRTHNDGARKWLVDPLSVGRYFLDLNHFWLSFYF